jgi:hypothetical protein
MTRETLAASVWISCFLTCPMARSQPLGHPHATVTLRVVDEFDRTVNCRLEKFTGKSSGVEFSIQFIGLQATGIPHGNYVYVLRRDEPGVIADVISGTVSVDEPEVLVIRSTERDPHPNIGEDGGPFVTHRGRLEPMPSSDVSKEPIWVKLTSVDKAQHKEVSVDPSGEFRIYAWLQGVYILSVIRGDEVLHVQPMTFETVHTTNFVIEMPQTPPSMLRFRGGALQ